MAEPTPGAGDISIELDGKEMLLRPSLQACMAISSIAGGLNAAVNRCIALDFDTICSIVSAGLGLNPTQAKTVPEAVYRQGLISLSGPCIEFIHVIGNGGKPVEDDDDDDDDTGEDQNTDENPLPPASQ